MIDEILKIYPEANLGKEVTRKCMNRLVDEYGFDTDKTILGTSVCSDEVVRTSTNFRDYLENGNPFTLGGLAGYPFTGLTGFGAFAGHIPDNGFAIIEYGPHIGFTKSGEIGAVIRKGQSHESTCCGAIKASVSDIISGNTGKRDSDLDYQEWKIEEQLAIGTDVIKAHKTPIVEATNVFYNRIDEQIKKLLKASEGAFKNTTVALVGGIIINTDFENPDWFDLREFSVHTF